MTYLYAILISYLIGAFQPSYIIGRIFFKKDIRKLGNGNVGASNALVVFGRRVGVISGIIDISKSLIAILIVKAIFGENAKADDLIYLIYISGFFAILGHNYPFYLKFKGGKGTAALFGFTLAIDYRLFIISIIVFVFLALITDYIVIGTLGLVFIFLIYTIYFQNTLVSVAIAAIIFLVSIYKHIPNYINISNGKEKKIRKSVLKK